MDKLENCLLECYVQLYKECGVDFMTMDRPDGFYNDYYLDEETQITIMNRVINSAKLKPYQRQLVRNSLWLGCSPSTSPKNKKNG